MLKSFCSMIVLLVFTISACSQNLPENYGIYAYTDKGRITLIEQKLSFKGNLLQSITGLKHPSGSECSSIKYFILFEKDMNPKHLRLSKLEFKKGGYVQNILGNTYVDVNLWTAINKIDFNIADLTPKYVPDSN